MSISLTKAAAHHIQTVLQKRGHGIGFKLAVNKSGCSGYSYVMDIADEVGANDEVFTSENVQVIVPQSSLDYLQGTEIDLAIKGLNRQLVFHNPNAENACGCGESFNLIEKEVEK
jgi:iron-sulfur cluster assembly protein